MKEELKNIFLKRKKLFIIIAIILIIALCFEFILIFSQISETRYYPMVTVPGVTKLPPTIVEQIATPSLEIINRKIIYNAWISLEVQDIDITIKKIQIIAEEFEGYISDMSISKKEAKTGYIIIRVPQINFYLAIERIEKLGEVKNKNIKSEDVTEQYIDLKARLENAQKEEKILLDFLNKAINVKDMLEIEKELSRIREQIEYYTGQLKYLESRIDYSTITIELSEPRPPAPLPEVDWDATIKTGIKYLLNIIQGLIILIFIIIPFIIIGIPTYYIYRKKIKKASK
jgi:hypothetical protein